ncbi:hypothetical protein [Streptomyces sp. P17]|uniref:hypothetical protein n=1 Tax=Streptomyces sp. P17 TaxID=3074716 RepID=UPI0028F443C0|nr:hypothetical protein [Streptomyces sp. P17]MDT9697724.1 hypothetical protein [Streptomyces sp. P17]
MHLPVPGTPAADDLRTAFAPFLEAAPNELVRQQFIAQLAMAQQLLGALREVGTVHCSIGLHRDDIDDARATSGDLLVSWFTIVWRDIAVAPRAVTVARAVTSATGQERVEFRELSCGPVAFSEATLMPSAESGLPKQQLVQFRGYLPHPDCKRLAILTLSTTALARREQYRTLLHEIAETVTFEDPLTGEGVIHHADPG